TSAISSTVSPPKNRNSTSLACRSSIVESRCRHSSTDKMSSMLAAPCAGARSLSSTMATPPPRLAARRRRAESMIMRLIRPADILLFPGIPADGSSCVERDIPEQRDGGGAVTHLDVGFGLTSRADTFEEVGRVKLGRIRRGHLPPLRRARLRFCIREYFVSDA